MLHELKSHAAHQSQFKRSRRGKQRWRHEELTHHINFNRPRDGHPLRGVENFDTHEIAIGVVIEDYDGLILIALLGLILDEFDVENIDFLRRRLFSCLDQL